MSDQTLPNGTDVSDSPKVPPQVRTVVYFTALIVAFLGILVTGYVEIFQPAELADQVNEFVGVVNRALLFLAGALGVAYRPTR